MKQKNMIVILKSHKKGEKLTLSCTAELEFYEDTFILRIPPLTAHVHKLHPYKRYKVTIAHQEEQELQEEINESKQNNKQFLHDNPQLPRY